MSYIDTLIQRSFIIPDEIVVCPHGYDGYSDEPEDQTSFVPDIQAWVDDCLPTPSSENPNQPPSRRVKLFYYDAAEFEAGSSFWLVQFRNLDDRELFRVRWHDDPRFVQFRKEREEWKRFREKIELLRAASD